jgi:hypothetical protein
MKGRVEEVLEGFGREVEKKEDREGVNRVGQDGVNGTAEEDKRREVQREMWMAMDEILG